MELRIKIRLKDVIGAAGFRKAGMDGDLLERGAEGL